MTLTESLIFFKKNVNNWKAGNILVYFYWDFKGMSISKFLIRGHMAAKKTLPYFDTPRNPK